jgi:hypothetical protein
MGRKIWFASLGAAGTAQGPADAGVPGRADGPHDRGLTASTRGSIAGLIALAGGASVPNSAIMRATALCPPMAPLPWCPLVSFTVFFWNLERDADAPVERQQAAGFSSLEEFPDGIAAVGDRRRGRPTQCHSRRTSWYITHGADHRGQSQRAQSLPYR